MRDITVCNKFLNSLLGSLVLSPPFRSPFVQGLVAPKAPAVWHIEINWSAAQLTFTVTGGPVDFLLHEEPGFREAIV